jgi:hypothetical protein
MIALVDHRLGEIQGGDAGALQETVVEQRLMHAGPVAKRRAHHVFQEARM